MLSRLTTLKIFHPKLTLLSCYYRSYSAAADHLFKQYYSRRLSLPPQELELYLNKLAPHSFSPQDHRWISLTQTIQTNLPKYPPHSQVYMLKLLVNLDSRIQLVNSLQQSLIKNLNELNFQETAVLLWCLAKTTQHQQHPQQLQTLSILYQHINQLLPQASVITIKQQKTDTEIETNGEIVSISATSLSMVLTSMASIGVIDSSLLKKLSINAIKDNISVFTCTALCTFLISFQKLGLRNKRATFEVYKQIRSMPNQVQNTSIETLLNLAFCVSNLSQRDPSQQDKARLEKHPDQIQRKQAELTDMRNFFGWICETIFLREPALHHSKAALILISAVKIHHFHLSTWLAACTRITQNIMDAKVIDLVMALKALSSLTPNKREHLRKQEQIITHRLWQLESSIAGKSLHTLAFLYKNKLIKPPPSLAKVLNQHLIELEGKGRVPPSNQKKNSFFEQKREEGIFQTKQEGLRRTKSRNKSSPNDSTNKEKLSTKAFIKEDNPLPNEHRNPNNSPKQPNSQRSSNPHFKK